MIIIYFLFVILIFSFFSLYLVEIIALVFSFKIYVILLNIKTLRVYLREFFFYDNLSLVLLILTGLLTFLYLLARYARVLFENKNILLFYLTGVFMLVMLVLSFMRAKVIYFYIFFEASLVPIFLIIIGWGYQPERLQAGIYILFYTLFASLPLLLVIINCFSYSEVFYSIKCIENVSVFSIIMTVIMILAFLVKLPIVFFHLWLPKAHVEAPVAGSIILAGVLLKLGGYGLWRLLALPLSSFMTITNLLVATGLIGGVVVSYVCFIQIDIKCLVAYSSVVHIGIVLAGLRSVRLLGYQGVLALMLGHGLVSSGLFYLVGINYDRLITRRLLVTKGVIVLFPSVTVLWFLFSVFNIRAPPSVSLLGELLLTSRVLFYRTFTFWGLMLMNFIGMVFTFFLYAQSQQGKAFNMLYRINSYSVREISVGWAHLIPLGVGVGTFWLLR
jgi:NADH-ubiquinone oxidoreductase chain 4